MVYTALSDDSSTVTQFTRRKKITISTNGTSSPANYQVKLTITYDSDMNSDFSDIRFNTKTGSYIDYWLEFYTASTTAQVWIEFPSAITDPGIDWCYMFYGNSSLSDGSVGTDVFPDLFRDFEDDTLSDWTVSATFTEFSTSTDFSVSGTKSLKAYLSGPGVHRAWLPITIDETQVIEFDWLEKSGSNEPTRVVVDESSNSIYGVSLCSFVYTSNTLYYIDATSSYIQIATGLSDDTWYHIAIRPDADADVFDLWFDYSSSKTVTGGTFYGGALVGPFAYFILSLGKSSTTTSGEYIDNLRIRNYIANEVSVSYGSENKQRSTPRFI